MSDSSTKPLPSAYEIAAPQTYDAFDLSVAKTAAVAAPRTAAVDLASKETAQRTRPDKPKRQLMTGLIQKTKRPRLRRKTRISLKARTNLAGE
jgi:hypothetical protein